MGKRRACVPAIVCIGVLISSLAAGTVRPATARETGAAVFLDEVQGGRPAAMAGAFTAVADDANVVFWNPAGLAHVHRKELLLAHTQHLQGFRQEYAAFCLPLTAEDSLAANVFFAYSDPFERLDEAGNLQGTFTETDLYFTLAYGRRLGPHFSAGLAVKAVGQMIDVYHGWTAAADLGLYSRGWLPGLDLALVGRNLGLPLVLIREPHALNAAVELGAAYRLLERRLLVSFDIRQPWFQELEFKAGLEAAVLEDVLALRAGYRYLQYGNDLGPLSGLTLGLGICIAEYSLDYAYQPFAELGDTHRIAVTLPFGRSLQEEQELLEKLEKQVRAKQKKIFESAVAEGDQWAAQKDYDQAQKAYNRALGLNPLDEALNRKLRALESALKQTSAEDHFRRGRKAMENEDYLTALVELSKGLELAPNHAAARQQLAKVQRHLSEEKVAQANNKNQREIDTYLRQGLDYLRRERYGNALEVWRKILSLDPDNTRVNQYLRITKTKMEELIEDLVRLADQDWERGRHLEAVGKWRQVLNIVSNQVQALARLAEHKAKLEELADHYYRQGVQHYVQNNLALAIGNWKSVLVLDPGHSRALRHLEHAHTKQKDLESIQ